LSIVIAFAATCEGDFLDDVKKTAGDLGETAWRGATTPARTVLNTGKALAGHGDPGDIIKPWRDLGKVAGDSIDGGVRLATEPRMEIYRQAEKFAAEVGGPAEFIFDVATFTDRHYMALVRAGGTAAGNILRGQNPLQLTATPLAAAIRAARERHSKNAKPLPEDVKRALARHFDGEILARAKYAVGKVQITLPNFIGQGAAFMGNDYAVVVDDIIVFNAKPPRYAASPFWWVHEITHVAQYKRWGVEKFAFLYVRDLGSAIENEADRKAENVTRDRSLVGKALLRSARAHGGSGPAAAPELFIAQCVFPGDRLPVHYLVTSKSRIVAVEVFTGRALHIGWATPPLAPKVEWIYWTPRLRYGVMSNGAICTSVPIRDRFGRPRGSRYVQVGHVVRLR